MATREQIRAELLAEMRKKGGVNRWKGLTAKERSEIGKKAAFARWGKRRSISNPKQGAV